MDTCDLYMFWSRGMLRVEANTVLVKTIGNAFTLSHFEQMFS